jgi:hypothetical protein
MKDPGTDLVKATASGVAEGTATAFLNTLLGPVVEAADSWRDRVRLKRWKAEILMLEEAREFLDLRGIDPSAVPVKTLLPLLDYAAREDPDDQDMIRRWAALLANAADSRPGASYVLPSFPRILAELSPHEAAILDTLYADPDPARAPSLYRRYPGDAAFPVGVDDLFYASCFNLEAHGLLVASWENARLGDDVYQHTVSHLEGNALGLRFVLACTPPRA